MNFSKILNKVQHFHSNISKQLSYINHSKFLIVGGGTAGISAARQILRSNIATKEQITIFDPADIHYYQPGFTMIAGGVTTNNYTINNYMRYDMNVLTNFVNFKKEAI